MHVLLADADALRRQALAAILKSSGFTVTEARSAFEAVALAQARSPSFVLSVAVEGLPTISQSGITSIEHTFGVLWMLRMSFPTMPLYFVTNEAIPNVLERARIFDITVIQGQGPDAWTVLASHLKAFAVPLPAPTKNVVRQEEAAAQPAF